jgi:hypothetical protein
MSQAPQPADNVMDLFRLMLERLDKMDQRLDDIQQTQAELRSVHASCINRIDKLDHEVFGNGRVGIAHQVRAILWIASGTLGFLVILGAELLSRLLT